MGPRNRIVILDRLPPRAPAHRRHSRVVRSGQTAAHGDGAVAEFGATLVSLARRSHLRAAPPSPPSRDPARTRAVLAIAGPGRGIVRNSTKLRRVSISRGA